MKVMFFFHRSSSIEDTATNYTIVSDYWFVLGVLYEIPSTFTVTDMIQCILNSSNRSTETDNVITLQDQITKKKIYRRSQYGFKPMHDTELMIPSNCDPDEIIEFMLV